MLAEKFILFLESLIRARKLIHADGAPRIFSRSIHVPFRLPGIADAVVPIAGRRGSAGMLIRSERE